MSGINLIPDTMSDSLRGTAGVLVCTKCMNKMPFINPSEYIHKGWPKCCGETMELRTVKVRG